MTDQMQLIREDVAFMRALAEEGRRAPPLGGAILFASGLIWSATSLTVGLIATRTVAVPLVWANGAWMVGLAVFFAALALLVRRQGDKAGTAALSNRVMKTAWSAAGWSIFTFAVAVAAACWRLRSGAPSVLMAPFVLTVYGVGWTLAAAMTGQGWLRWTAVGSFAAAVIMGCLADSAFLYFAYAAVLLLLMAVPGWRLMRQEPRPAAVA